MQIERRQRLAAGNNFHADGRRDQRNERFLNLEDDIAAALSHQRHVTDELERVAKTLLRVQQDGLAGKRLAAPLRLSKLARRQVADVPARLVFLPSRREVAAQEVQYALAGDGHGIAGIERAGAAKARERLVHAAHVLERETEVEVRDRKLRRERNRATAGGLRLFRAAHGP